MSWVLVLEADPGDPARKVAGLPLALRLGMDAQAAGASGVVLSAQLAHLEPLFADPRFKLPILDTVPEGNQQIVIGASSVVHRGLFRAIREAGVASIDLREEPFEHDPAWGFTAFTVVDAATHRRAERALFRALRKPQDGWTSRYLNRYISLFFSRWLVKTPLRPNQVSVGILGIGIAGAVIAARGGYWDLLIGAFLFQAQSVLDGCDGEMSRITYRGSLMGEWLDTVGDDLTNYGFFAGSAWGLYSSSGHFVYLVAGVVTVVCGLIASGLEYRYLYRIGSGDLLKYPLSQSTSSGEGLMAYIGPLFKRDTFVFLTLLAAIAGQVGPMLVVFCLGAVGILISVLSTELRLARERSRR